MAIPPWNCDTCGRAIERQEDGYVQWLYPEDGGPGLRLVHGPGHSPRKDNGCLHPEWSDLDLTSFLGPDGLLRLLYIMERFGNQTEHAIEMIKRLHVPGYDQARESLTAAANAGVYDQAEHLTVADIEAVLRWRAGQRTPD